MSPERSPNVVSVVIEIDRAEQARRGRLGAAARNARHDASKLAARAMATRLAKLTPDEHHAYFADLGRRS
jgi:O-acetyl-ADP-ribose deacetylase (regulator of RNase III)